MERIDSATLANKDYVAEQYRRYKADPRSVGEEWALFFAGFELGASGNGALVGAPTAGAPAAAAPSAPVTGVFDLVHSYRELGHLVADLNPLAPKPAGHPLLEPSEFGFGEEDLDRVVSCGGFRGCSRTSIRDLIARLQATYCGTLGVEYMHIQDQEQRVWLQERMETTSNHPDLSPEDRLRVLDSLIVAEGLEQFLQLRYPTAKRFSLEGSDSLIPFLHTLIEDAGSLGVEEMVFGMPHRGRINVLANVLRKPYEMIIAEFEGSLLAKEATGDGDVKYHLGYSRDHTTRAGRKVHLSLAANPSHLEAIDPNSAGTGTTISSILPSRRRGGTRRSRPSGRRSRSTARSWSRRGQAPPRRRSGGRASSACCSTTRRATRATSCRASPCSSSAGSGRGSAGRATTGAPGRPSRPRCCTRSPPPSRACPRASRRTRGPRGSWRRARRWCARGAVSTGAAPRRSPSARCCSRASRSA